MIFSSFAFIFYFLPATLVAYYSFKSLVWRNTVLFVFSLFFYSWGEPFYVALIVVSIFFNWYIGLLIYNRNFSRKALLVFGISINLAGILFFKYSHFFFDNIYLFFGLEDNSIEVVLPIGISFYTFQAISYLVDVYRGVILPQKSPLYFGTYLSMFPQLIAGPIVRYSTIHRQLNLRNESFDDFSMGIRRFIIGFCKKVFFANNMAVIADTILSTDPLLIGAIPAWYAFVAYSLQIFFDFSGYSDMAIGLGRMFGFYFLENFNYPYISRSVTEFWRRWHISLSTFFRDYLYIPMGGNRVTTIRWSINILIVWTLTGLWHGANWNFIFWGLYYGILILGEKIIWSKFLKQLPAFLQHLYTVICFFMGWVIFRIDGFQDIILWYRTLFGLNGSGNISSLNEMNVLQYFPWVLLAILISTPFHRFFIFRFQTSFFVRATSDICYLLFFLFALTKLASGAFNPFIYFRF